MIPTLRFFSSGREYWAAKGNEELRHHGANADDERTEVHGADVGGYGRGQQGQDQQREVDEQDPAAAVEVGHRDEEEQPQGIAALRKEGDVVGREGTDHLQQRLVVVEVDGDPAMTASV